MKKSSKIVVFLKGKLLLVRRRKDRKWTLPGGHRTNAAETAADCAKRELLEELPKVRVSSLKRWLTVHRAKSDGSVKRQTVFVAPKAAGALIVGDKRELDRAAWKNPAKLKLTRIARYVISRLLTVRNST